MDLHRCSRHRQHGPVQARECSGAEPDARQTARVAAPGRRRRNPRDCVRPDWISPGPHGRLPRRRGCRLRGRAGRLRPVRRVDATALRLGAGPVAGIFGPAAGAGKLGSRAGRWPGRPSLGSASGREGKELVRARTFQSRLAPLGWTGRRAGERCGWRRHSRLAGPFRCLCGPFVPVLPLRLLEPFEEPTRSGRPCPLRRSRRRTYVRLLHQTTNARSLSSL